MFWRTTIICVVYIDLKNLISQKKNELTREHFRSIIFYNFRRGLSQECIDELKSLFGNIELRKTGLMNSIVDDGR